MICEKPVRHGPNKGQPGTGLWAGYLRHRRAGEPACAACLAGTSRLTREWQIANPEAKRASDKRWREANRDHWNQLVAKWMREHPERVAEWARQRRARQAKAHRIGFTQEQLEQRLSMWGFKCWLCGGDFEAVDHVKPLAAGGAHCLSNLRPICTSCNSTKNDTWPLAAVS